MPYSKLFPSCLVYFTLVPPVFFYTDDGMSFYRNVCEMIANILTIIFLLKLSSKTHLNAPSYERTYSEKKSID